MQQIQERMYHPSYNSTTTCKSDIHVLRGDLKTDQNIISTIIPLKECMVDSVTNCNYVDDTKISVSIEKLMPTNAQ